MRLKIVYISQFTSYYKNVDMYKPGTDGFFLFGMGVFIARELMKRDYPADFEIWRTDKRIDCLMEKEIEGIKCRIFPSKPIKIINRNFGEYSKEIVREFKKRAIDENYVFHFMPNHILLFHYYAWLTRKRISITTHLGGANPYWIYKNWGSKISYLYYLLEKHFFLKNYNQTITISRDEADYHSKIGAKTAFMPIFGVSRQEIFTIKDRAESRRKLGLPTDKKILLQVGRAWKERGFDWIMNLIEYYKDKEEYYLVFAGINQTDKYYEQLKATGLHMTPYLSHLELPDYYNAADVLYFLPHGDMDLKFGGTAYVPLEAMLCGTPVVATSFLSFPDNEIETVARIPKTESEVIPMLEDILNSNISRVKCREMVLKNFSWEVVLQKHWGFYTNNG